MVAQVQILNSIEAGLTELVAFLPRLIGFLLILIVGYIVARLLKAILRKGLEKAGLDRRLEESDARRYVDRVSPEASPSNGISRVVFWLVFAFFIFSAIGQLRIPALTGFMNQVLAYIPNVIAAILIFVVAAAIAGAAGAGAARLMGDTPTGKVVGTAIPALVMVIAIFMILEQLGIAPEIVRIAFAATMGALALGMALAFGLGGRPVAERLLEQAYDKGQEQREQVRRDTELARERGRGEAERGRQRAQQEVGEGSGQLGGQQGYGGINEGATGDAPASEQPTRQEPGGGSYRST
jgi:Mechanosensitive ion channel, conserved TM helix